MMEQTKSTARPNVLFLMFDQMRADWFSAAGAHWCPTPNLDRLSAMGTRFTECVTNSPVCMAARIGLATGRRPHRLGVVDNVGRLMETTPNWYQHFRDHGYRVALRGKAHFDGVGTTCDDFGRDGNRKYLRDCGFTDPCEFSGKCCLEKPCTPYAHHLADRNLLARYLEDSSARGRPPWPDHDLHPSVLPDEDHIDRVIADNAIAWLSENADRDPWYCFVSFSGPHSPYDPPPSWAKRVADAPVPDPLPFGVGDCNTWLPNGATHGFGFKPEAVRAMRRNYTGLVRHLDEQVGRILDVLERRGRLRDTLIVFTADHGDDLGDFDHISKCVPSENAIRVPFILAGPGVASGAVSDVLCELNDTNATVCELAGLPQLPTSEALSLASSPGGREYQVSVYVDFRLIRTRTHKLVRPVRGKLYLSDRLADPHGRRNLAAEKPEVMATLKKQLDREIAYPTR